MHYLYDPDACVQVILFSAGKSPAHKDNTILCTVCMVLMCVCRWAHFQMEREPCSQRPHHPMHCLYDPNACVQVSSFSAGKRVLFTQTTPSYALSVWSRCVCAGELTVVQAVRVHTDRLWASLPPPGQRHQAEETARYIPGNPSLNTTVSGCCPPQSWTPAKIRGWNECRILNLDWRYWNYIVRCGNEEEKWSKYDQNMIKIKVAHIQK